MKSAAGPKHCSGTARTRARYIKSGLPPRPDLLRLFDEELDVRPRLSGLLDQPVGLAIRRDAADRVSQRLEIRIIIPGELRVLAVAGVHDLLGHATSAVHDAVELRQLGRRHSAGIRTFRHLIACWR